MHSHDTTPRRRRARFTRAALLAALTTLLAAGLGGCVPFGDDDDGGGGEQEPPSDLEIEEPQPSRETGQTSFVSAAGYNGEKSRENKEDGGNAGAAAPDESGRGGEKRQIQEGDIYRVIDHSSQILNLNRYRGLQVIDVSNPERPDVIGRAQITGRPVEMYLVGDKVYALMNDWRAYYTAEDEDKNQLMPKRYDGGVVAVIDISDPTHPKVTERARVPGHIQTSRITRGDGREALFVVASERNYGGGGYSGKTYVRSFDVSGRGKLASKTKLDLGGAVTDIQGAENHLIVARESRDDDYEHKGSQVSLIDISNPDGTMEEGDQVHVKGRVQNKHNLDLHDGVLRVVSGATWNGARKNHVETFDAGDIQNLTSIDHASFAEEERLEATLFMDDRAFFVTFRQIDPFFTFKIGDDGNLTRKSKFEVSGWNDYFVPVNENQRLVGIGMNNENGWTMAVSLYDATDLTNPEPMIARKEISLDYSRSEANRDDRAFTVLENATRVETDDGTVETGLVLLPFNGWNDERDEHVSGVQVFSFSKNTLTKRGKMEHGTPVRRSFMADRSEETTANLSSSELSLFDTSDPNEPEEHGRVGLAPNYSDFWTFDDYGVRRNNRQSYYRWYYRRDDEQTDKLEVVSLDANPDQTDAVTSISIPAGAHVMRTGDRLVVADVERTDKRRHEDTWKAETVYETELEVWDFSDPTSPTPAGSLTTTELEPHYQYRRRGVRPAGHGEPAPGGRSVGPGRYPYRGNMDLRAHPVDGDLVFVGTEQQRELKGTLHSTHIRADYDHSRYRECHESDDETCTYYTGDIHCTQLVTPAGTEQPEQCRGAIRKCTRDDSGDVDCQDVEPSEAPTVRHTDEREHYDRWKHYRFHTLELTDEAQPELTAETVMPTSERDVSYLTEGSTLYVTHREPYDVEGDSRPYYKYYFKAIDYSTPTAPTTSDSINIPGKLIAVDGDRIVTRDYLWGDEIVENSVDTLTVSDGDAYLQASHRFEDRKVQHIKLDGDRNVLVSHRLAWRVDDEPGSSVHDDDDRGTYMTVLGLDNDLEMHSNTRVADWATLKAAQNERALFSVPGGLLVADLSTPSQPTAQSYFPVRGWSHRLEVQDDGTVYLAAGRYGLYRFDLGTSNLLHD